MSNLLKVAEPPELAIYKWVIRGPAWVKDTDDEHVEYKGCLAVAIAYSKEEALVRLQNFAEENGVSANFIKVAELVKLPIRAGVVVAWHM